MYTNRFWDITTFLYIKVWQFLTLLFIQYYFVMSTSLGKRQGNLWGKCPSDDSNIPLGENSNRISDTGIRVFIYIGIIICISCDEWSVLLLASRLETTSPLSCHRTPPKSVLNSPNTFKFELYHLFETYLFTILRFH